MNRIPNIPFISIILIAVGVDFLLERNHIYSDWNELAAVILAVQAFLLVIYSIRDKAVSKAVWALIFAGSAVVLYFPKYFDRYFWYDFEYMAEKYWPVAVIALGVWLVFKSFRKNKQSMAA